MPYSITSNWSLIDYLEFTFTFDTKATRSERMAKIRKRTSVTSARQLSRMVPYSSLTISYYTRFFVVRLFQLIVANLMVKFVRDNRVGWNPSPFALITFSDWTLIRDYAFLGISLFIALDVGTKKSNQGASIFSHISCLVFETDFTPVMDHPYLSRSLREFWSIRWNAVIQQCLKRVAFEPVLSIFKTHGKSKKHKKSVLAIAAFTTFVVSALLHEWIIYMLIREPTTLEQFTFFTLHGVMSIIETVVVDYVDLKFGVNLLNDLPYPILFLYCNFLNILVAPLFFNPFIRGGMYYRLQIWAI